MKVEQDVGVPLHVAPELHWQIGLAVHAVLDVNVLQAVGVPEQVPPEDQVQLAAEVAHAALSANSEQGVGVPVQARASVSQTHPGKRAHVDAPLFASEHAKVCVCWQPPPVLENVQPGSWVQ
ncbi:MAG TPA: hypothetical protein VGC79_11895 [Polyangiaceae bacterium]